MKEILNHYYPIIESFLKEHNQIWLAENFKWIIESGILSGIIYANYFIIKKIILIISNRRLIKNLMQFYTPNEIEKATKNFIQTKFQNISPSRGEEPINDSNINKRELIKHLLKIDYKKINDNEKYFFFLADSGMGKTTFLINFYLKYKYKLFPFGKCNISLIPLGLDNPIEEIEKINDKINTILLLDAFDENPQALKDFRSFEEKILKATSQFRCTILTCRTQFFPNEMEEPKNTGLKKFGPEGGYFQFEKHYISPFDERDIKSYLRRKYSIVNYFKRKRGLKIAMKVPNLMFRPMLLNHIDEIMQFTGDFKYSFQIYSFLIDQWISREANRYDPEETETVKEQLYLFSRQISDLLFEKNKDNKMLLLDEGEIQAIADLSKINLSLIELKSRSLLNRNSAGQYKFSHKSIYEYFVAAKLFKQLEGDLGISKAEIVGVSLNYFKDEIYRLHREVRGSDYLNIRDAQELSKVCIDYLFDYIKFEQGINLRNVLTNALEEIQKLEYSSNVKSFDSHIMYLINQVASSIKDKIQIIPYIDHFQTAEEITHGYFLSLLEYCKCKISLPRNMDTCKIFIEEMITERVNGTS